MMLLMQNLKMQILTPANLQNLTYILKKKKENPTGEVKV